MPEQLTLDFTFEPGLGEEDFLVSLFNAQAFSLITRWPAWPERVLVLAGPGGSGKTHLATIFARLSGARFLDGLPHGDLALDAPLIFEDADQSLAGRDDEAALFHLMNRVREQHGHILITARAKPDLWGVETRDLLSRLRLAPLLELGVPDDALYRAVLAKLLHDRQLSADPPVIEYLFQRCERSFSAAQRIVALLDAQSLARKRRRITRSIAAEALKAFER